VDHRDPARHITCLRSERQREDRHQSDAGLGTDRLRVLLKLHQFDLFHQGTTDSSDKRGDEAVKKFAVSQSDAAEKRDKQLAMLQKKARLDITFPDEPNADRSNHLAGLDGAVGEKYLANFYSAESTEFESALSLLTRYSTKPDNDDIRQLAEKQLPVLRDGLKRLRLSAPK
jgi:hypothetical protein